MAAIRVMVIRVLRGVRRLVVLLVVATLVCVGTLRWVNPPATFLMVTERARLGRIAHDWVALGAMSVHLPLSAVAAEDANFCAHFGFDLDGIREALADRGRLRGGSTISQQVAKNVFLWPERTWLRKGLEAGIAGLIELLWPKRRILEVYLNVAEFDTGVFGVGAASEQYFGASVRDLGPQRSARLMTVLPDPKRRSPVSGSDFVRDRGASIERGAATIRADGRADCFVDPATPG